MYSLTVTTLQGLEEILAGELRALNAKDIAIARRAVTCKVDQETMYRAIFYLRTAIRVLVPKESFSINNADDLYEACVKMKWEELLRPNMTFAIDHAVFSKHFNNSQYAALRMKDAIADRMREVYGRRSSIDKDDPDFRFHLHIDQEDCTISIDAAGGSLHRRGYRVRQGPAPLNEALAAGLIMMTGWNGEEDLYDLMCGGATFLIEAAGIGANLAPARFRTKFAYQIWPDYNPVLFNKIKRGMRSEQREMKAGIFGSDKAGKVIELAEEHIENAKVRRYITLRQGEFREIKPESDHGMVICNLPYGERVEVADIDAFYAELGDHLKKHFDGFTAWLLSGNPEAMKHIGLRHSQSEHVLNGAIECKFRKYEMYQGSRKGE